VYLNGVHLARADYTATNGSDVVLAAGAAANDTVEIVSFGTFEVSAQTFTGDVTASGGTFLPTGDTAAGDDAAVGYAAADGLVLTGQGSTSDVTIKNDADATVMSIATGTTGATFAGDVIIPDGDLILGSTAVTSTAAELNILDGVTATAAEINLIDGGTARGTTAVADGDGFLTNDGGTMRMTKVDTLATYMGTKIGGGMEFLASSGAISDGTASVIFNQFDASKYDYYIFNILAVVPVTDSVGLLMQLSADGTNYDSTNGNYHEESTDKTGLIVSPENVGGASGELNGVSAAAKLFNIHSTTAKTVLESRGIYQDADPKIIKVDRFSNYEASAAAHTAVKILFNSGNIESGEITMFGIVNS